MVRDTRFTLPALFGFVKAAPWRALLVASLTVCSCAAAAPEMLPPRFDRVLYRTLSWADYRVDDKAPGMSAQTQTYIGYRYKARASAKGATAVAVVTNVQFYGGVDRAKSWRRSTVKPDDFLLLQHEQGHLDINEVKVRQLQTLSAADMPIGSGKTPKEALAHLDKQMIRIYKTHVSEMQAMQRRYDTETAHGTQRDVQGEWTGRLLTALRTVGSTKVASTKPRLFRSQSASS